jgi:hypothetical protein
MLPPRYLLTHPASLPGWGCPWDKVNVTGGAFPGLDKNIGCFRRFIEAPPASLTFALSRWWDRLSTIHTGLYGPTYLPPPPSLLCPAS